MRTCEDRIGFGSSKGWVAIATAALFWIPGRGLASDPAVAETNFRAGIDYVFSSIEDDSASNGSLSVYLLETEKNDVDFRGVVVVPVAHSIGLRLSLAPNYSTYEVDGVFSRYSKTAGLGLAGDVFFRDPDRFEIGLGPRYSWDEPLESDDGHSIHSLAGIVYGRLFLGDPGIVPIDVEAFVLFGEQDLGEEDRTGGSSEFYEAGGGLTFYPHARLALGAGASYREEDSSAFADREREIVAGRFFVDFLALRRPGLIVGPRAEVGEVESSLAGFEGLEQRFYSVGLAVSLNFPGAESLVDLSRRYF